MLFIAIYDINFIFLSAMTSTEQSSLSKITHNENTMCLIDIENEIAAHAVSKFLKRTMRRNSKEITEDLDNKSDDSNSVSSVPEDSEYESEGCEDEYERPALNRHESIVKAPNSPLLGTLVGHVGPITKCLISHTVIVSASLDGSVLIWSRSTGISLMMLPFSKPVHELICLHIKEEKYFILCGTEDGRIHLWKIKIDFDPDLCKKTRLALLSGHLPNPIRAMAINKDRTKLVTGCCFEIPRLPIWARGESQFRGTVKLWNVEKMFGTKRSRSNPNAKVLEDIQPLKYKTMKQIVATSLNKHIGMGTPFERTTGIRSLLFTPDGRFVVVGFGFPNNDDNMCLNFMAVCSAQRLDTLWVDSNINYQLTHMAFLPGHTGSRQDPWELVICTKSKVQKLTMYDTGKKIYFTFNSFKQ